MPDDTRRTSQLRLVAGCFLLSGFAALLYETAWLREFSISFGTSDQALSIVLGTYMGGLAIGSLIASRFADRLRRPLLTYGLLELGIAVSALAVPCVLQVVRSIQIATFGGAMRPPDAGQPSQVAFAFLGAAAATIVPTAMMGATLPMLAKHVVHDNDHLGPRIGWLYTINTLGAVIGTLTAAFLLLPTLGLRQTIYVGVGVNVLVFVLVYRLMKLQAVAPENGFPLAEGRAKPDDSGEESWPWILWLIGLSGAVSFAYEILFTRMLGHIIGGTVFAFAVMLASFLMGITIGAGIASKYATNRANAAIGFVWAQCGTAILALVAFVGIESIATIFNGYVVAGQPFPYPRPLMSFVVLLLPAVTIGMTFPFAIRMHARGESDAAGSSAKVYACNTIGGVTGAFLTGTYLLPATNYQWTLAIAAITSIVIACLAAAFAGLRTKHFSAIGIAVVGLVLLFPAFPEQVFRASPMSGGYRSGLLTYATTGRSATVSVYDEYGSYYLSTNGLPEAGTNPRGSIISPTNSSIWLGILPTIVRPETKSALVVGFGTGVAAASVPQSVESVDVFELEEAVIEANKLFRKQRDRDPLSDPRINIILNDGRSGLAMTQKRYDAIISQPSHPWTAGASHLYTRQFAELVHQHLTDDGVFVQWMGTPFVNEDLFRSLGATLLDVFDTVQLFRPEGGTLIFVAAKSPLAIPTTFVTPESEADRELFGGMGVTSVDDILVALAIDDVGLRQACKDATITTDNNNLLALREPPVTRADVDANSIDQVLSQFDPLIGRRDTAPYSSADLSYIARRRDHIGRTHDAGKLRDSMSSESDRSTVDGFFDLNNGKIDTAKAKFESALMVEPDHSGAAAGMLLVLKTRPELRRRFVDSPGHRSASFHAVAEAIELLERNNMNVLARLDEPLAMVDQADPLFVEANMKRVEWRLRSATAADRKSYGRECLDVLERMYPQVRRTEVLIPRLEAAAMAGRPNEAVTTAQSIAMLVQRQPGRDEDGVASKRQETLTPPQRDVMRTYLARAESLLSVFRGSPQIDSNRFEGVMFLISQAKEVLAQ